MLDNREPIIIQGGMGVAVSSWGLARAVAQTGQLGVVSGTALDLVLARRLQLGDPDGHLRRAMAEFPLPGVAERVLERHWIEGGKAADAPFRAIPILSATPSRERLELTVIANFVEVFLAREGHDGLIGVNYLEKIQTPTLPSLFGALLAGVDYVLMGAGIPRTIPGILDSLAHGEPVELSYFVDGARSDEQYVTRFDPVAFCEGQLPWLVRPKFLAIISSATLATMLVRKATGHVDGFVVEGPTAGGHNAPPRGPLQLTTLGEPIYGPRDVPDLRAIADLGRPFWLAGSYADPQRVVEALEAGAAGVQVGTAFAYCHESGLDIDIRRQVIAQSKAGTTRVKTDPLASPTGFPFKVLELAGSMSQEDVYQQRQRVCDLGYLRHAYKKPDGSLGWRCGAEDVDAYARKGGQLADTQGRKCICNGLLANVGLAQLRKQSGPELPLITSGDDVSQVARFLPTPTAEGYSAEDVVAYLLSAVETGMVAARQFTTRAPEADMFERRSLKLPITLGVLMIVSVIALTVGWVLLSTFAAVANSRWAPLYWTLLTVGTAFLVFVLVGVVLYLRLSVETINLNRRQSNFIDSVTHELKSPLASLKLYLQTLERCRVSPDKQESFVRYMLDDVARLDTLINHLLDAARLDHRIADDQSEQVDLAAILASCIDTVCLRYHVSRQVVRLDAEPVAVRARAVDVDLLLRNLIDNAIKYAGDPPAVEVRAQRTAEQWATVQISDNGRGIPPALRRRVFGRFYRLGDELERETPGLGLGLYLVRTMVRRLRGTIRVRDREGGPGTTIEVTLPAAKAGAETPAPDRAPGAPPQVEAH